jgi:SH3 domain-containing YSC84-like protein 1
MGLDVNANSAFVPVRSAGSEAKAAESAGESLTYGRPPGTRDGNLMPFYLETGFMHLRIARLIFLFLGLPLFSISTASAQVFATPATSREAAVVDSAVDVLGQIMAIPGRSIPESLLSKSEGIVIIPDMIKGGFIVGVRHGRGVVVTRDENGKWKPPMFVEITGASVGWQAGLQGTDLVLVFRTKTSLQNLMRGKFTIGATASAAAGPVGRDAQAATDARLKAEIFSYSRSRGLFAGVALDGAVLNVDQAATNTYYQPVGGAFNQPGQPVALPPSANRLQEQLAKYTPTAAPPTGRAPAVTAPMPATGLQALRGQLAASSRQLSAVLDPAWRTYLALPAEVYARDGSPAAEALRLSLDRFTTVGTDARYQHLAQRPEFRNTWSLLQRYSAAIQPAVPPLVIPPPPR